MVRKYFQFINESAKNELKEIFYELTDEGYQYRSTEVDGTFERIHTINLAKKIKSGEKHNFQSVSDDIENTIEGVETIYNRIKECGYNITNLKFTLTWAANPTMAQKHNPFFTNRYKECVVITHGSKYLDSVSDFNFESAYKNTISHDSSLFKNNSYISTILFRIIEKKDVRGDQLLLHNTPSLEEHYLYIDSLNESLGVGDVGSYLKRVFDRISKASEGHKRKILIYALSAMMFTSAGPILNTIKSDPIIKSELSKSPDLKKIMEDKIKKTIFKDPQNMKLSKSGWTHLKYEEGDPARKGDPILKAYSIGDGAITVGWGHAEKSQKSKYVVGQTITKEEAQELLEKDASIAADGVRKIFKEWKKQGINRHISQGMFDALVSMSFNMGIGSLRGSQLIQDIKKGNYEKAGHLIKQTKVNKKFGGLVKRRESESKLFLSYLKDIKQITHI